MYLLDSTLKQTKVLLCNGGQAGKSETRPSHPGLCCLLALFLITQCVPVCDLGVFSSRLVQVRLERLNSKHPGPRTSHGPCRLSALLVIKTGLQLLDLPRYHSLVERIDKVASRWRSTGHLMGPANVGDGYILEVQIPLSGEEGDFVLGQMDRTGKASDSSSNAW